MSVTGPKRIEVLVRDQGKPCAICRDVDGPFEVDHINPRSNGGEDELDNLQTLCRRCNRDKNNYVADAETGKLERPAVVHVVRRAKSKVAKPNAERVVPPDGLQIQLLEALIKAEPLRSPQLNRDGTYVLDHLAVGGVDDGQGLTVEQRQALQHLLYDGWVVRSTNGRWGLRCDYYDGQRRECTSQGLVADLRERLSRSKIALASSTTRLWAAQN